MSMALLSCSSNKIVKSDTSGIDITQSANKTIEIIKGAYLKKDMDQIQALTTDDTFRLLKTQIKNFDQASLSLTPIWVEINKDTIQLSFSWEGTWKQDNKTTKERGVAVFVLLPETLKLSQILRSSPFLFP